MPKCENCAHLIERMGSWACAKMSRGYLERNRIFEDRPCDNFEKCSCKNCVFWDHTNTECNCDRGLRYSDQWACLFYKPLSLGYLIEKAVIPEVTPIEKPPESSQNAPGKRSRPDKGAYYLNIAKAVSERSTCLRRQYGAIIVKNDEIISTGYNGSPRGEENCCDCGECYRAKHKIPHGERYEECVAVHAEANAIISASRRDMIGATLYLYGSENGETINAEPCKMCERLIRNAGIDVVVTSGDENGSRYSIREFLD